MVGSCARSLTVFSSILTRVSTKFVHKIQEFYDNFTDFSRANLIFPQTFSRIVVVVVSADSHEDFEFNSR